MADFLRKFKKIIGHQIAKFSNAIDVVDAIETMEEAIEATEKLFEAIKSNILDVPALSECTVEETEEIIDTEPLIIPIQDSTLQDANLHISLHNEPERFNNRFNRDQITRAFTANWNHNFNDDYTNQTLEAFYFLLIYLNWLRLFTLKPSLTLPISIHA